MNGTIRHFNISGNTMYKSTILAKTAESCSELCTSVRGSLKFEDVQD